MKEYTTEFLRNVALVSHGGAGKTMLAEAFLHATGAVTRLGKVEDGTTISDYDDEEHRRKISIYSSVIPIEHRDHKINIIDAPGYTDFVGEMISALSVADGAIILVDAVAGIEVGTELAWRYADEFNLPRFFVINKMDRDNADFEKTYAAIEEFVVAHGKRVVRVHIPIGEKQNFKGVVDVIGMKAYIGDGKMIAEIPADMREMAEAAHFAMVEDAAEGEDELMEIPENGSLTTLKWFAVSRTLSTLDSLSRSSVRQAGARSVRSHCSTILLTFCFPSNGPGRVAMGKDGEEELTFGLWSVGGVGRRQPIRLWVV
jgi:elongation factor G